MAVRDALVDTLRGRRLSDARTPPAVASMALRWSSPRCSAWARASHWATGLGQTLWRHLPPPPLPGLYQSVCSLMPSDPRLSLCQGTGNLTPKEVVSRQAQRRSPGPRFACCAPSPPAPPFAATPLPSPRVGRRGGRGVGGPTQRSLRSPGGHNTLVCPHRFPSGRPLGGPSALRARNSWRRTRCSLAKGFAYSLAHLCLGIATPDRNIAKYGTSLSHLEISGPWVGRLRAVQKPPPRPPP